MTETTTLRGYKIRMRKGIQHWDVLLEEWLLCIEQYCSLASGDDAPFIYTERANIGVLAGAAWRRGWIALEEFQYQKGYKNKPKWNGRADLYLASKRTEEVIEAKFSWLSLRSPRSTPAKATKVLDRAIEAAKQTKGGNSNLRCLAVAFLPVWFPSKRSDVLEKKIQATISELSNAEFHALAWCFPKEFRRIENSLGNFMPGIIMVVSNLAYR